MSGVQGNRVRWSRDGIGHDRDDGQVVALELLGAQAEGGCQPSVGGNKRCQLSCVAGEVQRRVDAVRVRLSHRGGEVTAVIDHLVSAVVPDEGDLLLGGGGGDDVSASGVQELDGDDAHAAGGAGHEHGVPRL